MKSKYLFIILSLSLSLYSCKNREEKLAIKLKQDLKKAMIEDLKVQEMKNEKKCAMDIIEIILDATQIEVKEINPVDKCKINIEVQSISKMDRMGLLLIALSSCEKLGGELKNKELEVIKLVNNKDFSGWNSLKKTNNIVELKCNKINNEVIITDKISKLIE